MRRGIPLVLAAVVSLFAVTQASAAPPAHANANAHANSNAAAQRNFVAPLSAGEEVADPPVVSNARGNAIFRLSKDGTELHYKLIVANIENVTQAHIHVAPAGANGPVVVWLYPDAPPATLIPGRSSGILAQGVITEDDLVGAWADDHDFDDLIEVLRTGGAYVNVHTSQFPGGEVRGQIR
jgi:hypothetical protein